MPNKMKCPECGNKRIWKAGMFPSRKGKRQRYMCSECAKTFYKEKIRR